MSLMDHLSDTAIRSFDTLALGAIAASLIGWLPQIGAGLSVVWLSLRIGIAVQEYRINQRKLRDG